MATLNPFSDLDDMISAHRAWSNDFFKQAEKGLPLEALRKVCPEYHLLTAEFPEILAQLVARTSGGTQFHLVSILYSELGGRDESHAHSKLFRRLCEEIGISGASLDDRDNLRVAPKTIAGLRSIYRDAPLTESLGAQYALEYQADNMLQSFRRAFALFDWKKSQESGGMLFFKVHRSDEPRHASAMQQALVRYISTEADLHVAAKGARDCLELFADFWEGLLQVVPNSARVGP